MSGRVIAMTEVTVAPARPERTRLTDRTAQCRQPILEPVGVTVEQ